MRKRRKALSLRDLKNPRDVRVLNLILETNGSARTTDILARGSELGMAKQTIINTLESLEKMGWLENQRGGGGDRRTSIWKLTPEALEAYGRMVNQGFDRLLSDIEKTLSAPSTSMEEKVELIRLNLPAFEDFLGFLALSSLHTALERPTFPDALEEWRMDFTATTERYSLALLHFLYRHREAALKAFPKPEHIVV